MAGKLTEVAVGLAAVQNMEKSAAIDWAGIGKEVAKNVGNTALKVGTIAGTATALGYIGNKVISHRDSAQTQQRFNASLNMALAKNPILANANKEDIKHIAQTVYNLAPHAAGDPNVLASVLANAIHGAGLDPKTARDLMELEEKHYNIQRMTAAPYMDIAKLSLTDWQKYDTDTAEALALSRTIGTNLGGHQVPPYIPPSRS